jgi:hypothetical protein
VTAFLRLSLILAWVGFAGCSGSGAVAQDAEASSDAGRVADVGFVVEPCTNLCNARRPSYPFIGQGEGAGDVTMYATGPSKGGACNYGETNINYYVASNVNVAPGDGLGQWQNGRACGQCVEIEVQTTTGPRTVIVRITDRCADEFCGMDLGGLAPGEVMSDGFGRYRGSWRFVSCAGHPEVSDGPTSLNVLSGSNPYWALVQVRNPPWPVAAIDWQQQGSDAHGTFTYAGVSFENAFQVPQNVLQANASFTLTIRYTDGSQARLTLTSADLASEHAYPL